MKRFLLDAIFIIIIVIIGMSLDESTLYKNKQENLYEFEQEIQNQEIVDDRETQVIVNQVKDNNASKFAVNVSNLVSSIVEGGITLSKDFFEYIVNDK